MDEPLRFESDLAPARAGTANAAPNGVTGAARPLDFDELVRAEYADLYGAMCLIVRDRAEAEDVTQDAFLKVWERWERVHQMASPSGYLYRTAFNLHRKRSRRASVAIRRAVGLGPGRDSFNDVDTRDSVVRALGTLTPRQRESVVLVDLLDYSSEEAARLMGIKASTVRVLASQGRALIRRNAGETDE
jgi:RNA polymerase sigma-70 factor (ECF subfamily)